MVRYSEIRSRHIRNCIRGSSWSTDRAYIDQLVKLESYILTDPKCLAGALYYYHLKEQCRSDWKKIFQELRPQDFKEAMLQEKTQKQEGYRKRQEMNKRKIIRDRCSKKEWLAIGGNE